MEEKMKLSLNWIKDFVKIPDDMDLKRLAYDLTMSTVEVEDAIDLGKQFDNIIVGEIKEVLPHPNVLRAAGLDPDEYTGFYVNIGLDRLVMMRYGVDDVRLFHSADLRFLKQFH